MSSREKTTVVLTDKAQRIKDDLDWLGLKEILSAGLELLAELPPDQVCAMVKRIKQEEPRGRPGRKPNGDGNGNGVNAASVTTQ